MVTYKGKQTLWIVLLYVVILLGDASVGKTNVLQTFLNDTRNFNSNTPSTIGIEFGTKDIQLQDGTKVQLQIWDTAGQERYRAITSTYAVYIIVFLYKHTISHYRKADGAMILFDLSNTDSFENAINYWKPQVLSKAHENSSLVNAIFILGNKSDLNIDFPSEYSKISAKTGLNISESFQKLAQCKK